MQNKTKHSQYRQGDVLILSTSAKLPKAAKEIPMSKMGPILALGEVTGHHHTVVAEPESYKPLADLPSTPLDDMGMTVAEYAAQQLAEANKLSATLQKVNAGEPACRLYTINDKGDRMLVVGRHTILRHEEHPAIGLAPGNYKVIQQQEFTPEGWQNVQD